MGYYTDFILEFENKDRSSYTFNNPNIRIALEKELLELEVFDDIDLEYSCRAWAKWYDYEDDMRRISQKFPDILFYLHGDGEDGDDKWDDYFLNGGYQHCPAEIYYPPFDPSCLDYPEPNRRN